MEPELLGLLLVIPIAGAAAAWALTRGHWMKRVHRAVLAFVFPPAVLWIAWWHLRGREPDVDAPREPPAPVSAPDSAEFVPEPATACPDCGYLGIRPPGVQDGVYPGGGELILYVCPRCHYRGVPIRFQHREDYLGFLRRLRQRREAAERGVDA